MLVLSRRTEESIAIGNDTTITVVSINGGKVKLGIQAPDDVRVLRTELLVDLEAAAAPNLESLEPAAPSITAASTSTPDRATKDPVSGGVV